jgi:hypothetical protein
MGPRSGRLILLAVALALAGCGLQTRGGSGQVSLVISRDFGARALSSLAGPAPSRHLTIMQLLTRNVRVVPRSGGRAVQSIEGASRDTAGGHPLEWLYFVNGVLAPKGPAATPVYPGDRIWWDLHDTSVTRVVPAVVGSYPEPFVHGIDGQRLPVRVECAPTGTAACRTVIERLHAIGATPFPAALGGSEETQTLRVLVGTYRALRVDPAAATLGRGPKVSGVYARFSTAGSELQLLDADGANARGLIGHVGLVAATAFNGSAPIWLVTGTDGAGVQSAAGALQASDLEGRYAVAVEGMTDLPVPLSG